MSLWAVLRAEENKMRGRSDIRCQFGFSQNLDCISIVK